MQPLEMTGAPGRIARDPGLINRLRLAMLANGVDILGGPGGLVSATHGPREVALTLEAFRTAVRWLKADGDIRGRGLELRVLLFRAGQVDRVGTRPILRVANG